VIAADWFIKSGGNNHVVACLTSVRLAVEARLLSVRGRQTPGGLTPVVVYKLEQRHLAHRGHGEEPLRLVAKINIDTLESDPFFLQRDGGPLNERAYPYSSAVV
jgi:hypothetical protein